MLESLTITTPRRDQIPAACRALFPSLSEPERSTRCAAVAQLFASGVFDPAELLIAQEGEQVVGAGFVHQEPGKQASVWSPGAIAGPRRDAIVTALAGAYRRRFLEQDTQVAQFLQPDTVPGCPALEHIGFRFITRMEYLARRLTLPDRTPSPEGELRFVPVDDTQTIGTILVSTYEGSLDVPELNDTRTADEILLGYATHSDDAPPRWYRIDHGTQPIGVLMLSPGNRPDIVDLGYLGLVPLARGKGLGKPVVAGIIGLAARMGTEWLTVSLDERNTPASKVYRRHRFGPLTRQCVYLWKPAYC